MPSPGIARTASPVLVWTAILILYVVWGSTYLGIRVAVGSIPPFGLAAVRFALAGLVILTIVSILRRKTIRRPTLRQWRDAAIIGALFMGGGMGMVAWGEQTVPSGIAGVLIAMMPVWVAVFGRVFFGERLPWVASIGIAVGMAGVALLIGQGVAVDRSLDPAGVTALVLSPIAWSAGSLFSTHGARLPDDPFVTTGMEFVTGASVLGVMSMASGELSGFRLEDVTQDSAIAFVYLTVVGSLIAFTAFAWVLRHAPLPLIATYAFVNPVIAVFLGWLILQESISPVQLVAGGVIVVGVALIIVSRNRLPAARQPEPVERGSESPAIAA